MTKLTGQFVIETDSVKEYEEIVKKIKTIREFDKNAIFTHKPIEKGNSLATWVPFENDVTTDQQIREALETIVTGFEQQSPALHGFQLTMNVVEEQPEKYNDLEEIEGYMEDMSELIRARHLVYRGKRVDGVTITIVLGDGEKLTQTFETSHPSI